MAGANWNVDRIGYESAIDLEKTSRPSSSLRELKQLSKEGVKNENDNKNANSHTFLVINFVIGFKESKRKATSNGYAPI
jgi:hypothetical protein